MSTSSASTTPTPVQDTPESEKTPQPATSPQVPDAANDSSPPDEPKTTAQRAFQHGLNRSNFEQEVGQVMGTLNTWWGGFKQQSASALTTLKADFDKTLEQAQTDLEHLRNAKVEIAAAPPRAEEPEQSSSGSSGSILERLSASTSQLQHTLQSTLQTTLANAPSMATPAQIRQQLAENVQLSTARQNIQLSMKQAEKIAEEYMKKGDHWVKEAEKWMEDAVKVVPPDQASSDGLSWEGLDSYPGYSAAGPSSGGVLFDAGNKTPRASTSGVALGGSRQDILLNQLREDSSILLKEPSGKEYEEWVKTHWPEGVKEARAKEEAHVGGLRMALVPEQLSDDEFWKRYLYNVHLIEVEVEKRQQLLKGKLQANELIKATQDQTEDFNWDDEPEEAPAAMSQSATTLQPPKPEAAQEKTSVAPSAKANTSTSTSPRDSEESYDLVSDQGAKPAAALSKAAPANDDDEDSDWE